MNRSKKYAVAITLIIATLFMGVLPIEKSTIQTGTNTSNDCGSWLIGSREPGTTGEASQYGRNPTEGTNGTGQPIPGSVGTEQQGDSVLQFDRTVPQESDTVESNSVLPVGAGCTTNVQVRPGYRYYTVEELRKGLLYDLEPLSPYFIQAQEDYKIDAVFLAAVAAEESGWGRHKFRKNNIFGFENCDFDSLEQCIDHAAKWIKTQYLTPGGLYYEGVGVTDINVHYNSRKEWEEHVIAIMGQIVDRVERTDTE